MDCCWSEQIDAKLLNIGPDDILVISVPDDWTAEDIRAIADTLNSWPGYGGALFPYIVMKKSVDIFSIKESWLVQRYEGPQEE